MSSVASASPAGSALTAANAHAAAASSSGVAVAPASSAAPNSNSSNHGHAAALAAASAVSAAAASSFSSASQLAADFFFTPSSAAVVIHGSYSLSGTDCVALARTVDLLARCGFTPQNDARFASLLSLWTFVHRFHSNTLKNKLAQVAANRAMEPQLMQRTGLFTRQQYMQMIMQIKCMACIQTDTEAVHAGGPVNAQSSAPTQLLDIMRAFTKPTIVPNSLVEPQVQQEIMRERLQRIHQQVADAASPTQANTRVVTAAGLANGSITISSLVAQDPAIAFFQTQSMSALSYPPNTRQLEALPGLLGSKYLQTDPCTLLSDVLSSGVLYHAPSGVDVGLLKAERDRMVRQQIAQRKDDIDTRLQDIRNSSDQRGAMGRFDAARDQTLPTVKPPLWMEIDSLALGLVDLQRKVRARVLRALPADTLIRETYRSRKDVEVAQRIRDKAERKTRVATERHLKKTRRNYLTAIVNHCRDFQTHHRELHRRLCKAVCAGVLKWHEDRAKRALDLEKSQEKTRLALLKDNNEEAYIAMLKDAKNERLLNLLKQTDDYMDQLSRQIVQEQDNHAARQAQDGGAPHAPHAPGHIPTAGELMHGDVFQSTAGRVKTSADKIDEAQEMTAEELDRLRMQKREEEEQRVRDERTAAANGTSSTNDAAAMTDVAPGATAASADGGAPPAAAPDTPAPPPHEGSAPSGYQSSRNLYYSLAHKKKEIITEQPKMLKGGTLRAYQMEGLQWLVSLYNNQLNGILADEMGLGKTVQTLSLLAHLMEVKHNYGPFLIIVPMSTLHNNWEYECDRWLPGIAKVVYDGDKERRRYLRDNFIKPGHFNIVMTTFEFAMRDKNVLRKIPWAYIIIDEAHRLKNPNCKLALELATYPTESRRVALTGTPLQNELHELWSLLNFVMPTLFNSCDTFEKWFSTPFDKMPVAGQDREKEMAMNEEEKLLVINRLHSILRPFMLRREKSSVETDLADKIEKVMRCELTPTQRAMYEAVLEGKVTMHNKVMQLRKIANHPILFHPYMRSQAHAEPYRVDESMIQVCGKFVLLDQILVKLKRTGHRVLIFNQMTKVMDILEEFCRLRSYTYLRLDGSTAADVRTESLVKFNAPDSPYFIFMLSTKAGGLGLNLQSADTVILFDSDWNPQSDKQAMARSHRLGQKSQVIVLRFITTATVEEKVLSTATTKLSHEQLVIQAGMFHEKYSHNASRAIATEAMSQVETGDDDAEQWTDSEISRTLARSDAELAIFLEMDAQAKRHDAAKQRELPQGKMPRWAFDWCVNGQMSTVHDASLTPFNDKLLEAARAKVAKASGDGGVLGVRGAANKAAIVEVNSDDDDDRHDVVAEASGVNDAAMNDDGEERPLNYDDTDDDEPLQAAKPQQPLPQSTPVAPAKKSHKKGASGASHKKKPPAAPGAGASGVKRKRDEPASPMRGGGFPGVGHSAGSPYVAAALPVVGTAGFAAPVMASPVPAGQPTSKKPKTDGPKRSHKKKAVPAAAAAAAAVPLNYHSDDDDHYTPLVYSDDEDHAPAAPQQHVVASSGGTTLKLVMRPPGGGGGAGAAAAGGSPAMAPMKKIPKKKNVSAAAAGSSSSGPVLIKKASGTFSLSLKPQQSPH